MIYVDMVGYSRYSKNQNSVIRYVLSYITVDYVINIV